MSINKENLKELAHKAENAAQKGAEKVTDFAKENAPKVSRFAKDNAPKVKALAKKGADKAVDVAKKSAPVVKDIAKSVGEELRVAGGEVKDFAGEKINEYKNRKNIKVYTTSDVADYDGEEQS